MRALLLLLGCLTSLPGGADPRTVYGADSPAWMQAVGKLRVPGITYQQGEPSHQREDCSATLVAHDLILTAWHCLEYRRDLSRDITFTLPQAPGRPSWSAWPVADGGGMHADWALLRLAASSQGWAQIPALSLWPSPTSGISADAHLTMAGYSADDGLGASGSHLTYHASCAALASEPTRVATNCLAFKGASGGPVVSAGQLVGVISAGDKATLTYYVPANSFAGALRRNSTAVN
jgi:V8-like Glu-specific endopeptidase